MDFVVKMMDFNGNGQADCATRCSANETCNGRGECDPFGQCLCNEGFAGASCDSCDAHFHGSACDVYCDSATTCGGNGRCR